MCFSVSHLNSVQESIRSVCFFSNYELDFYLKCVLFISPFIDFSLSLFISLSLSLRYSVWTPLGDDKRLVWRLPRIQVRV